MKSTKTIVLSSFLMLHSLSLSAADFDVRDEAQFKQLFPDGAKVEKLADGFGFTEGPTWVRAEGGYLVFSDIPNNRLIKWTKSNGISTFRQPSQNANGNTTDRAGRLLTAEHSGRRISVMEKDGSVKTLVDRCKDKKFSSPNDVVVKSDGTVWFTDPPYGLPKAETKEQDGNYVYRFDPSSQSVRAVATDFDMPNGLCFSPDETKLYIADSGKPHHIRVFNVGKDGSLSDGKVFAVIDKGGPDGIRCDTQGRIWSSSGAGADIFAADGSLIAKVNLPKAGANLCFGGENGKTLFVTARDGLYAVETKVNGAP